MTKYPHPPGSSQAILDGCKCPVSDNGYGRGSGYFDKEGAPLYWYNENCELHGKTDEALKPEDMIYEH